jgi:hypothetical protein
MRCGQPSTCPAESCRSFPPVCHRRLHTSNLLETALVKVGSRSAVTATPRRGSVAEASEASRHRAPSEHRVNTTRSFLATVTPLTRLPLRFSPGVP